MLYTSGSASTVNSQGHYWPSPREVFKVCWCRLKAVFLLFFCVFTEKRWHKDDLKVMVMVTSWCSFQHSDYLKILYVCVCVYNIYIYIIYKTLNNMPTLNYLISQWIICINLHLNMLLVTYLLIFLMISWTINSSWVITWYKNVVINHIVCDFIKHYWTIFISAYKSFHSATAKLWEPDNIITSALTLLTRTSIT